MIIAHIADQFFWGTELEQLGIAGKTLRRTGLKAGALAREIQWVLADPRMAKRAGELAEAMAKEDGVAIAVKLVETRLLGITSSVSV